MDSWQSPNDEDALKPSAEKLEEPGSSLPLSPHQEALAPPTAPVIPDLQPWQDPFKLQRLRSTTQTTSCHVTLPPTVETASFSNEVGSLRLQQQHVGGVPVLSYISEEGFDLLKSEVFLSRLVKLYGPAYNIEADAKEVAKFQLETCEQHVQLIKRQEIPDLYALRQLLYGNRGSLMVILMGLVILILGLVIWLTTRTSKVVRVPYETGAATVTLDLGGLGNLKRGQQVILAFWIDQFYSVERTVYGSQPKELVSGLSCDPHHRTLKDLFDMRPKSSLAFANLGGDPSASVFPCGTTPFTFFNDKGYLDDPDSTAPAQSAVPLDPDYMSVLPYSYIVFKNPVRPPGASPDWVPVDSDVFRNWVFPPAGAFRYLPIGRTARDFMWKTGNKDESASENRFTFKFTDSTWPADHFAALKGVAAIRLSGVTGLCPPAVGLCITVYGICLLLAGLILLTINGKFKLMTPTISVQQLRPHDIRETVERVAAANAKTRQVILRALREGDFPGGGNCRNSETARSHATAAAHEQSHSSLNLVLTDSALAETHKANDGEMVPPPATIIASQKAATARATVGDRGGRHDAVPKRRASGC